MSADADTLRNYSGPRHRRPSLELDASAHEGSMRGHRIRAPCHGERESGTGNAEERQDRQHA
jgi:hypothetical protein